MDSRLGEVNVSIPARVESYNPTTGRISAQPLIPRAYTDEEGNRQLEDLPVVNEIPIQFPGSGGARVKFPISVGDTVLLLFSQASLDKWLVTGTRVDPGDDRRHALTDAVAITGLLHRLTDADPQIEFTSGGEIHAGGASALALNSDLESLRAAIAAAVNGNAVPGAAAGVGPFTGTDVLKGS
jgi:hypothetical protein